MISEGHVPSEKDSEAFRLGSACLLVGRRNAERQERFAAGANLFWFDEGMWPEWCLWNEMELFIQHVKFIVQTVEDDDVVI